MLELQDASYNIWDNKHRLKDSLNNPIDKDVFGSFSRVANALSAIEEKDNDYWYDQFYTIMCNGCYPAGRILANAGSQLYKPNTTLINCVVGANIKDSLEHIMQVAMENGMTLKTGAGIGYCFSTLRPRNAFVGGVGATTSGPLSFADIFDKICFTISSAGGRRGSMMLTFHVFHPDIFDVIKAKREQGRLRQFNISILITDSFMNAVKTNADWDLYFPLHKNDPNRDVKTLYAHWPILNDDNYTYDLAGRILCKIYRTVPAVDLWNAIMEANYNYAEPGFILIDKVNDENNLYFVEDVISTNP